MTKKKQRISNLELLVWKLLAYLFVTLWILALLFTVLLVNRYGSDDLGVGFITFFLFLVLAPITYAILYAALVRLRLRGSVYIFAMSSLILASFPSAFFLAIFISITSRFDSVDALITIGAMIALADIVLLIKTLPKA